MKLQLTRPLAFIDLEATGVDRENDRIVEIAVCKLEPSGQTKSVSRRVNPTIPIPQGASDIHGITDEMVKDEPTFKQLAKGLLTLLEGCDIAGFNSNNYDVPMLFAEFSRAGHHWDHTTFKMIDVGNLFKIKEPRTLTAAVKFYCGRDLENAHSAQADIEATVDVFISQMTRYENDEDFPQTLDELALYTNYGNKVVDISGKFVYSPEGLIVFNFGKYKGKPAINHIDFLEWMMGANFAADTYTVAAGIVDKFYNGK